MGSRIRVVKARETYGRGRPGVEAEVITEDGSSGLGVVLGGGSMGNYEALFLTDGGDRYGGKGTLKAVSNVNDVIAPKLIGMDATDQRSIDRLMIELDGTSNKSRLGGNAIGAVSAAVLRAASKSLGVPLYRYVGGVNACILPVPVASIMGGMSTRYGAPESSNTGKPDFHFVAYDFKNFSESIYALRDVYSELEVVVRRKYGKEVRPVYGSQLFNRIQRDDEVWDLMVEAIDVAGYTKKVGLYMDCAACCYYDEGEQKYVGLYSRGDKTREDLVELYRRWVGTYPILALEDPLDENDFEGHASLVKEIGIEIVGDDLFATSPKRLQKGIELGSTTAMLLKFNQVGTVTEALDAAQMAIRSGLGVVPCGSRGEHNAGEQWLGDVMVGLGALYSRSIKMEGECESRLLRIEEELDNRAVFPGKEAFRHCR
jgi:enolase